MATTRKGEADPSDPVAVRIDQFVRTNGDRMGYLYDRWADEHEYEDWREYTTEMKKLLPADFTFLKATQSPFGFQFCFNGSDARYRITITASKIKWSRHL